MHHFSFHESLIKRQLFNCIRNLINAVMENYLWKCGKKSLILIWMAHFKIIVSCCGNLSKSIETYQMFKIQITLTICQLSNSQICQKRGVLLSLCCQNGKWKLWKKICHMWACTGQKFVICLLFWAVQALGFLESLNSTFYFPFRLNNNKCNAMEVYHRGFRPLNPDTLWYGTLGGSAL